MRSLPLRILTVSFILLVAAAFALAAWAASSRPVEPGEPGEPKEGLPHSVGEEGNPHENRLAGESSPYLLLHKGNPVDWYPWGPEALDRARREGKPIFLSVGYSTCYWCHVMERESFSDSETAALMNRHFVNIKVDREERPDLDEIYMTATQLLTGRGGWPNSVWLTPDLQPFYAGTYFPPTDQSGRPGFPTVLRGLAEAWQERRPEVLARAEDLSAAMRGVLEERVDPAETPPPASVAGRARDGLASRFDETWGGFGDAPKFPTPSNLFLLQALAEDGDEAAGRMLRTTLDQMIRGGIFDQLGGGFHRYATDRQWKVPHFEKMLYDNGLLLQILAREHRRTADPQVARAMRETAEWVEREMTSPRGAFWSAIDAETNGHEGAFYVWSSDELKAVLGEADHAFLAPLLGFSGKPFFEEDRYVLHLPAPLAGQGRDTTPIDATQIDATRIRFAGLRAKLLAARAERPRPRTDDKTLTDWNGMMIAGLADAGHELGDTELVDRAARAARFVLAELWPPAKPQGTPGSTRTLQHSWRLGEASIPAFLADYAHLVRGLLALHRATGTADATGEAEWLEAAVELTEEQLRRLRTPEGGFYVAAAGDDLLFRSRDPFDGAVPSANGVALLNLLDLAEATGDARWRREARAALAAFAPQIEGQPLSSSTLALAAYRWHAVATEAAQEQKAEDTGTAVLRREAEGVVTITARATRVDPSPEAGWLPFAVRLSVEDGWHVNANPASLDYLVPTSVEASAADAELRRLRYPAGETLQFSFSEEELAVYSGSVEISGEIRSPEQTTSPALQVTYQACDDQRCLPPVTREVRIEPAP